jgi:ribose/xylose/arabinose/galactoside ABC-type transport system permease subunit
MSTMSEIPLPHTAKRVVPWWLLRHETMLALILLIALTVLGGLNNRFLTLDNLLNQGRLTTEVGLIALPMTFIIITGGIDLSARSCSAIPGRISAFPCRWRLASRCSSVPRRAFSTGSSSPG